MIVTMRQITVNNNAWLFSLVMYERTAIECCYHETNNCKQHMSWLFSLVMYERTAIECCYHETNNC